MDLSFIRRHRARAIDLPALLARTAATQSASPTARAQVRLEAAARHRHEHDPHVALFAFADVPDAVFDHPASFADMPGELFRPRQPN